MAIRHNRETVRHNDPTLRHQNAAVLAHKSRTLRHNELDDIQTIPAGSLTVTGQAIVAAVGVGVARATITFTGLQPSVLLRQPGLDTVTFTGLAPEASLLIDVPVGQISVTGQQPEASLLIDVPVGQISVTGQQPASLLPQPAAGSLSITELTPTRVVA